MAFHGYIIYSRILQVVCDHLIQYFSLYYQVYFEFDNTVRWLGCARN